MRIDASVPRPRAAGGARAAARLAVVLGLLLAAPGRGVAADWLLTPFMGMKFSGETSFVDLDSGVGGRKLAFGGSADLLGPGVVGVEAEFSHIPRFLKPADSELGTDSGATTVMGDLLVAMPVRITHESWRPYAAGGMGLIHVYSNDLADLFPVDKNLLGFNVGGGAFAFFSDVAGIRLDLRYFKSVTRDDTQGVTFGTTRLSFWRFYAGVVLR